ncbi:hypothetical protein PGT21_004034 [Puccinia graminis f. sp. tritici]|uniref:Uncharacterized protein n=1 Tax=Puccinia graminis f. sp. tritici TaxID=56615 RepID=A0A5B0MAL8_PUCGR|nr:hypothetical protein PGT21_004034 [Puccinia graminis f. sp. tritici]
MIEKTQHKHVLSNRERCDCEVEKGNDERFQALQVGRSAKLQAFGLNHRRRYHGCIDLCASICLIQLKSTPLFGKRRLEVAPWKTHFAARPPQRIFPPSRLMRYL